jgi:hypothetical protein
LPLLVLLAVLLLVLVLVLVLVVLVLPLLPSSALTVPYSLTQSANPTQPAFSLVFYWCS